MKLILEPVMQSHCARKSGARRRPPPQTSGSCLPPFFRTLKRKLPR
jgi:hypothetical protein